MRPGPGRSALLASVVGTCRQDGIARRAIGTLLAALFTASIVLAEVPIVGAAPNPSPTPGPTEKPRPEPGGPVVREAVALPLNVRDQGGPAGGAGRAPSDVQPRPIFEPTSRPGTKTERTDLRTERTRTFANPDGTYELEVAAGRLHYQALDGGWVPIDLALRPTAEGPYSLEVTSLDRTVRFGESTDLSLASLGSSEGLIGLRALDYGGTIATDSPLGGGDVVSPSPSPEPTPSPSPGPATTASPSPGAAPSADIVEPSPPTAAASVEPFTSVEPSASVVPSIEPSPSPSPSLEPSTEPSPPPSTEPSPTSTPAPSASADPSPSPVPSGPPTPPSSVLADNGLIFDGPAGAGRLFVHPTDTGFGFGITLGASTDAARYSFALDTGGLSARLADDGRTILLERTSRSEGRSETALVGVITAPVLLDANEVPAPPETVTVSITTGPDAPISDTARSTLLPTEVVVSYAIDPIWLADPTRAFPITLDPDACLGEGASGCAINGTGTNFDHFVMSGLPTQYPVGWTTFRVGYDVRSDDGNVYGKMRGLVYFQDVALPDGAVVYDTNLKLHISSKYGGPDGEDIRIYRITKGWSQTSTWNGWSSGAGYSSSVYAETAVPSGSIMNFDVDAIVQAWYTRRGKDWKGDLGFAVKMVNEGSSYGEVEFDRYNDGTASYRPLLVIHYEVPKVSVDFAPELGPNYAPSTMIAGQPTSLPVTITNNGSGFDFTTANWRIGYRFFGQKGDLLASGIQTLPACVGTGGGCTNPSATIGLAITPPATPGSYVLRLDLIRVGSPNNVYASD
jgi:hypothetical protein